MGKDDAAVLADPEDWSRDPWDGGIHDGFVWGRGALDMKNMVAMELVTMLLLKRHVVDAGIPLERDVIFLATSDEETGGDWGLGSCLSVGGSADSVAIAV